MDKVGMKIRVVKKGVKIEVNGKRRGEGRKRKKKKEKGSQIRGNK